MRCLLRPPTLGLLALALLVLPAQAHAAECPPQAKTQLFAWASDTAWYFHAPGGSFEAGTPPWALTGSASVVTEPRPTSTGRGVLRLGPGAGAVSPSFCADATHPHVRFATRAAGPYGSLRLQALRTGRTPVTLGTVQASAARAWALSPRLPLAAALGIATGTTQTIRLRLTASGTTWRADDVAVDPYRK